MYEGLFVGKLPQSLNNKENLDFFKGNSTLTKKQIIEGNVKLVLSIAMKYDYGIEVKKDIVSEGIVGLIKAVETYDYKRGTTFSSYASTCIYNEINMYFKRERKHTNNVSLEQGIIGENVKSDDLAFEDIIVDEKADIEENYEKKEAINLLKELVVSLSIRDTFIVSLYFGLFDNEEHSQSEIAFRLNISRSYVSRLVNRILITLKELILNPPKERKRKGKSGSSIFKLLKGYDRKLIWEVIDELNEEDRILLYLRCGRNLDNPVPSPFWNANTAYKFNTRLLPKMKRKLEEKMWLRNNQVEVETLSPMEKYRREKLNEIHSLLLNMDMVNAQIVLHEYLNEVNLIQYENFIVSLIILSVMDKDFTFEMPIRSLVLLQKEYKFDVLKYKDYFYESLINDIHEAPLYLDIITCLQKNRMVDIEIEPLEKAYERALNKK